MRNTIILFAILAFLALVTMLFTRSITETYKTADVTDEPAYRAFIWNPTYESDDPKNQAPHNGMVYINEFIRLKPDMRESELTFVRDAIISHASEVDKSIEIALQKYYRISAQSNPLFSFLSRLQSYSTVFIESLKQVTPTLPKESLLRKALDMINVENLGMEGLTDFATMACGNAPGYYTPLFENESHDDVHSLGKCIQKCAEVPNCKAISMVSYTDDDKSTRHSCYGVHAQFNSKILSKVTRYYENMSKRVCQTGNMNLQKRIDVVSPIKMKFKSVVAQPSFVKYPNSSTNAQYIDHITQTLRKFNNAPDGIELSLENIASYYPMFNFHERSIDQRDDPNDIRSKCPNSMSSPNFAFFFKNADDETVFRSLVYLEHFMICLQLEYGFDFTLYTSKSERGYMTQKWDTQKLNFYIFDNDDTSAGFAQYGLSGTTSFVQCDTCNPRVLAHEFFHLVQRVVPAWHGDKGHDFQIHEGTANVAMDIVPLALKGSPLLLNMNSFFGSSRFYFMNRMFTRYLNDHPMAVYNRHIYFIVLMQQFGYDIFGKMYCDTDNDATVYDTLRRLCKFPTDADLMHFFCSELLKQGIFYVPNETLGDVVHMEWYSHCTMNCTKIIKSKESNKMGESYMVTITLTSPENYPDSYFNPSYWRVFTYNTFMASTTMINMNTESKNYQFTFTLTDETVCVGVSCSIPDGVVYKDEKANYGHIIATMTYEQIIPLSYQ